MTTRAKTIPELLTKLHSTMTDAQVGDALGVTGQTVWRWRHEVTAAPMPRLVWRALADLLTERA